MDKSENKIYELAFNIVPTLSEEVVSAEFANIKDIIAKLGGSFIAEQSPKPINLAYTMNKVINNKNNKFGSAHFGWVKFEIVPSAIAEIKKILDRDDNIIRFMTLSTVRENTLAPKKTFRADGGKRKSSGDEAGEEVQMDKEAVDKKIEELSVA